LVSKEIFIDFCTNDHRLCFSDLTWLIILF